MRVFLVGYMGSGKTSLGKKLANRLSLDFFDLDDLIEKKAKVRIEDIFKHEGEAAFRGMERKALKELIEQNPDCVIATGGGTPCFYDNMHLMNKEGLTVYLKMDVRSLVYRLENSKDRRPLIRDYHGEKLIKFVKDHLSSREDMYLESQMTIAALGFDSKKMDQLVDSIQAYSK